MKINDRDKKLIIIFLILCIIGLPIWFVIRPCIENTKAIENEIATLQAKYDYLEGLKEQQPFFESEIKRFAEETEKIIKAYGTGIAEENTIMFLRNEELELPIFVKSQTYSKPVETPIFAGAPDETGAIKGATTAVSTSTTLSYQGGYDEMKQFLDYMFNFDDKTTVSTFSMKFTGTTFEGSAVVNQYAIKTDDRVFEQPVTPEMSYGNESVFAFILPENDGFISPLDEVEEVTEEPEADAEGEETEETENE